MHRRHFIGTSLAASVALFGCARARTPASRRVAAAALAPLPKRDRVKVAFMLGDDANVIDTAGPWEVFQDVVEALGQQRMPSSSSPSAPTRRPAEDDRRPRRQAALQHRATRRSRNVIVVPAHKSTGESRALAARGERGHRRHDVGLHRRLPARARGTAEGPPRDDAPRFLRRASPRNSRTSSCAAACASSTAAASRPPAGSPPASTWRCTSSRATSASRPPRRRRPTWSTRATPGGRKRNEGTVTFSFGPSGKGDRPLFLDDGGRLDLDLGARLEQPGDDHDGHRGKVAADQISR